jgi:copper chaperone
MIEFHIPRMSCSGCARTIEAAVQNVDPAAAVTVDLAARRIAVVSSQSAERVQAAIEASGYASERTAR